jgi:hypothetical protein
VDVANEAEQVEINIREGLLPDQRAWVVARLKQETGMVCAWFPERNHRRIALHDEPEHFRHQTLPDYFELLGFPGKIEGEGYAVTKTGTFRLRPAPRSERAGIGA